MMTASDIQPDRLDPHNRERRDAGTPYAYADGFGTWHAVIPAGRDNPERIARALIRDELDMRGERGPGYRVRVKPEPGRGYQSDALRFVEVTR
ncbi:MAG: hypothetical protein K0Q52_184 [Microbacterium sp.]|jgi:hypothetical protein|nr:hypothetical protein [Microbacterium sp.]